MLLQGRPKPSRHRLLCAMLRKHSPKGFTLQNLFIYLQERKRKRQKTGTACYGSSLDWTYIKTSIDYDS